MSLSNLLSAEECDDLRLFADRGGPVRSPRIFLPIRYEEASGRAACRWCGETIEKGLLVIAFAFDPYAVEGVCASWGHLAKSYIHASKGKCADPRLARAAQPTNGKGE